MLGTIKSKDKQKIDTILQEAIKISLNQYDNLNKISKVEEEENSIEKYDNKGQVLSNKVNEVYESTNEINDWEETDEIIEFGILDFNKTSIYTRREWNIEDEKVGAFFIYNSTEDLSYKKIFLRDKETQEILWMSPLKYLPKEIKISNSKSRVVYMSSKVIFEENLKDSSETYELYIEDNEENAIEFKVNDIRNNFEDMIVRYEENKISYLINFILKYSNYEISRKDVNNEINKYNSSIIIEKIGNKYSVLLNKPQNIMNKVLFLKDDENRIYHDCNGSIDEILSIVQKSMDIRYGTTIEEFNDLEKLIITDTDSDLNEVDNLNIVYRKDVLISALRKDIVFIDKDIDKINIMLYDEQEKILTISVDHLNNGDMEELFSILNYKKIVTTGIIQESSELDSINEQSISMLLCSN